MNTRRHPNIVRTECRQIMGLAAEGVSHMNINMMFRRAVAYTATNERAALLRHQYDMGRRTSARFGFLRRRAGTHYYDITTPPAIDPTDLL